MREVFHSIKLSAPFLARLASIRDAACDCKRNVVGNNGDGVKHCVLVCVNKNPTINIVRKNSSAD